MLDAYNAMRGVDDIAEVESDDTVDEEQLRLLQSNGCFLPVCESRKRRIFEECRQRLGKTAFEKKFCAVCDRRHPLRHLKRSCPEGQIATTWCDKLAPTDEIPLALRQFYDVSGIIPQLKGALLSCQGMERDTDGFASGFLFVCQTCDTLFLVVATTRRSFP